MVANLVILGVITGTTCTRSVEKNLWRAIELLSQALPMLQPSSPRRRLASEQNSSKHFLGESLYPAAILWASLFCLPALPLFESLNPSSMCTQPYHTSCITNFFPFLALAILHNGHVDMGIGLISWIGRSNPWNRPFYAFVIS